MISEEDVKYVAALSRIHLKNDEVVSLKKDLEKIIGYVDKLGKLDVTNVPPTSHALPIQNVYREDEIKPSLPQEEVMKLAIEKKDGFFKVPKVIE